MYLAALMALALIFESLEIGRGSLILDAFGANIVCYYCRD